MGHLILAQTACESYELAKVIFIPCANPPHKDGSALLSADHRLAMVQAAIEGDLRFEASDMEIARGGVSFAVDTVRQLHDAYPKADLHFIIGTDTLLELYLWRDIDKLLSLCTFVAFARPGFEVTAMQTGDLHLPSPWGERLLAKVTRSRLIEISSSDIRHRIAEGLSIRYLVPAATEVYISEHRLYGM